MSNWRNFPSSGISNENWHQPQRLEMHSCVVRAVRRTVSGIKNGDMMQMIVSAPDKAGLEERVRFAVAEFEKYATSFEANLAAGRINPDGTLKENA